MKTLYFDLETGPRKEAVDALLERNPPAPYEPLPDFDADSVKTGNIKDESKIAEKRAAAHTAHSAKAEDHQRAYVDGIMAYQEKALEKAPLCPSTAQILCIQYASEDCPVKVISGGEKWMLGQFFKVLDNHTRYVNWVGHNRSGGNFDLNQIYRRAWALGVLPLVTAWQAKERTSELASQFLQFADWGSYYSLENAARELGIDVEDTKCSGKYFSKWWNGEMDQLSCGSPNDQRVAALDYAKQDVVLLQEIDRRLA